MPHRLCNAEIPVIYLYLNDIDRQLWEIDDNLQQAILTQTQEAKHLKRRGDLWEARNKGGKSLLTMCDHAERYPR